MKRAALLLYWFIAMAVCGAFTAADARELHASGLVEPQKPGLSLPAVRIDSSDLKLDKLAEGRWNYSLTNEKRVLGLASVALENTPESYHSVPMRIRLPYESDAPIKVTVYAVKIDDSNDSVRDIFGTNVVSGAGIDLADLFQLYQQAAVMSSRRLASIQNGRQLYQFDVQIFFKFLEIARELGKNVNLAPGEDVRKVRTFLRTRLAVPRDRKVIERAIQPRGATDVEQLLSQIDSIEAEQLKRVWHQIKKSDAPSSGSPEACARYSGFRDTLLNDFDPLLRQRWDADRNYMFTSLVTEVLTLCVTRTAEKAVAQTGTIPVEVKREIGELYGPVEPKLVVVRKSSQLEKVLDNHNKALRKFGIRF